MAVMTDARATFLAIVKGDTSQAVTEFKRLGSTVEKETTGANNSVGKFRSYTSSAFAEVKANAGMMAAGAGAALVAFGIQSANAFSQAAKAAIDLGQKTGFSTEQASRWIAVADDFQVSADTLATSVGRIAKDLDSDKWAKYGIATRDAAGNARSANDIFLDVLDVLSRTDNETERARLGAELLGRGWQGVAPILGKTRREYEDMLASVDRGQVITEGEAQRAEEWRMANDRLQESFGLVRDAVGQVVVEMAPLLEKLADAIELLAEARERTEIFGVSWSDALDFAMSPTDYFKRQVVEAANEIEGFGEATIEATGMLGPYTAAAEAAGAALMGALDDITRALMDERAALDKAEQAQRDFNDAVRASYDAQFAAADAADQYRQDLDDLRVAVDDATTPINEYDVALRDAEKSALDLAYSYADAVQQMNGGSLSAEEYNQLVRDSLAGMAGDLAPGSPLRTFIEGYIGDLARIPTSVTTDINVRGKGAAAFATAMANALNNFAIQPGEMYASGTPSAKPGLALVGEQGPELVQFGGGERVYTAGQTAAMLSGRGGAAPPRTLVVNVYGGDPEATVRAIRRWERYNGPGRA